MGEKVKKTLPSSSLSCLPDEIVLDCLVRVPRRYYENVSSVSKRLRSLVRSPELHRLRSLLHKDSIYVCFHETGNYTDPKYFWFTLRQTKTAKYKLVPIPFPARYFMFTCSTVAVDSEIYFIGGFPKPTELWILDTRTGKLRQGPIMRESRFAETSAVGVIGGKIYVTQVLKNGSINEEVFDLESKTWKVPGVPVPEEKVDHRTMMDSCVTLEGKVYSMYIGSIYVYNLRQGREEKLDMPIDDMVWQICVADNLLFAFFTRCGLMWLDTRTNEWKTVSGDVQTLHHKLYGGAMAEHYGKLALFWKTTLIGASTYKGKNNIWCSLIALTRVGDEEVRGTIEWSSVVATTPYVCTFMHCLVVSD